MSYKTILVFVIVYFLSDLSYGQRDLKFFRKDYTYLQEVDSFYKLHQKPQIWSVAKQTCAQEGATLFYPENETEAKAVIAFWTARNSNIGGIFLGMSDILVEGLFETIDGKAASEVYHNWQPGQPDDYRKSQDCAYLFKKGDMDDGGCDSAFYFICKKSLQSLEWNYQCNMPGNLDYTFNQNIGKCYKLHITPLNWMEAHAVCRAEQSYLAIITNRMEANYLASLTEPASKQRVGGSYLRGMFHLGFHNRLYAGWQTVKGTPLNDVDTWWGKYQPEANDSDQCGAMFYTGRLTHIDCAMKSFFICENQAAISFTQTNSTQVEEQTDIRELGFM